MSIVAPRGRRRMARRSVTSRSDRAWQACARRQLAGFTYLGVLFAIALLGITLAVTGTLYSLQRQRSREQELLWVGAQYRAAIARYHQTSALGVHAYPRSLADLLDDRRDGQLHHHIRRLYPDPMTGLTDWDLQLAPDGAILGIASRAQGQPIKRTGFRPNDAFFENSQCYCDWRFVYLPLSVAAGSAPERLESR